LYIGTNSSSYSCKACNSTYQQLRQEEASSRAYLCWWYRVCWWTCHVNSNNSSSRNTCTCGNSDNTSTCGNSDNS